MSWSNTDLPGFKPNMSVERQVRQVVRLVTANTTNSGNTNITFTSNAAAQGVAAGQYVYIENGLASQSANGLMNFFTSNTTVSSVSLPSGNNVQLAAGIFTTIPAGTVIEFDQTINYAAGSPANTYNGDTILVTATRAANANSSIATKIGNMNVGWNYVQKKTNSDGTVRYLKETLVALASPTAYSQASGNTTTGGSIVTGL